jgi:predicted O-methyltransferase YrrM
MGLDTESLNYKDLQVARALAAPGHITVEEARFLGELTRRSDPTKPIIEIGTLFGFSTLVMVQHKAASQRLITVDNYSWNPLGIAPEAHRIATRTVLREACERWNVDLVAQDKDRFYETYSGETPSLFFCDADHSYEATLKDLMWAKARGCSIICGHDYHPVKHAGVSQAVQELGGPRELHGSLFVL